MSDRLLGCCCGPLFARAQDEEDLYAVLDVSPRASADDIRRAYRRKSLRLHPDKVAQRGETVTAEHREAFQSLQRAYEVLREPEKRQIYDRLGLLGIRLANDPMGAQQELFQRFTAAPPSFRFRVVGWLFLVFAFLCIFPLLAAAEIDGLADFSWLAMAVPVWLYCAVGVLYHGYMLFAFENPPLPPEDGEDDDQQVLRLSLGFRCYEALKFALKLLQLILLFAALDDVVNAAWGVIFLPLFVLLALRVIEGVVPYFRAPADSEDVTTDDLAKLLMRAMEREERRSGLYIALDYAFFLLQLLLLSLRLDGSIDASYWLVSLPLFVYIGVSAYLRVLKPRGEAAELLMTPEDPNPNEDELLEDAAREFKQEHAGLLTRNVAPYCSALCCQLILLILVLVRIEEADFSTYIIYIPVLIPLCCFFCCVCLSLASLSPDAMDEAFNPLGTRDEEEGGTTPPGTVEVEEARMSEGEPPRNSETSTEAVTEALMPAREEEDDGDLD